MPRDGMVGICIVWMRKGFFGSDENEHFDALSGILGSFDLLLSVDGAVGVVGVTRGESVSLIDRSIDQYNQFASAISYLPPEPVDGSMNLYDQSDE
eukprot:jgi/Psemu1/299873/fgenesh1_kg.3_\